MLWSTHKHTHTHTGTKRKPTYTYCVWCVYICVPAYNVYVCVRTMCVCVVYGLCVCQCVCVLVFQFVYRVAFYFFCCTPLMTTMIFLVKYMAWTGNKHSDSAQAMSTDLNPDVSKAAPTEDGFLIVIELKLTKRKFLTKLTSPQCDYSSESNTSFPGHAGGLSSCCDGETK